MAASVPNAENRDVHAMTHYLKWSQTEKRIPRKALERALDREFQAVIRTAKEMAGKIEQPADLWDLESYLTQSRNQCCGLQSVPGRFPLQVVSGQFPEGLTSKDGSLRSRSIGR